MFPLFRAIALIEGVTTLALFLVAMPLKYAFGNDVLIAPLGMAHGLAFLAYLAAMILTFGWHRVGPWGWLRGFAAALVPFGTFLNDAWVVRQAGARAAMA